MTIVGREIRARERAFLPSTCSAPTATSLVKGDGRPRCCYCRRLHSSGSCKTITDVAQQKGILKKTGKCFVCLKRHHMSKHCPSSVSCAHCNGRHHTSISAGSVTTQATHNQVAPATSHSQTQTSSAPRVNPAAFPPHTLTTTTGLYCVNSNTPVLFQTAQVYIYKPDDPNCGMMIRMGGVSGHMLQQG